MNKDRPEAALESDGEEAQLQGTRPRRQQTAYGVDADHFRWRLLQDLLAEGLACHWERRARTLLAARSRPGDFLGTATPAEVALRDQRLRDDADRCRRHAVVIRTGPDVHTADVRNVFAEVA